MVPVFPRFPRMRLFDFVLVDEGRSWERRRRGILVVRLVDFEPDRQAGHFPSDQQHESDRSEVKERSPLDRPEARQPGGVVRSLDVPRHPKLENVLPERVRIADRNSRIAYACEVGVELIERRTLANLGKGPGGRDFDVNLCHVNLRSIVRPVAGFVRCGLFLGGLCRVRFFLIVLCFRCLS